MMTLLIYIMVGMTLVGLTSSLVLLFKYGETRAPRWQAILADGAILMLCFAILSKGNP